MSITNSNIQANYDGNGTTKVFNTGFYFLKDSDVVVSLKTSSATDVLTLGSHYSITGSKVLTGGSVTLVTAPAEGEELIIRRTVDYTQEDIYVEHSAFPAKTLERSLDKVVMMVQQLKDAEDRQITIPDTDASTVSMMLPDAETRAGLIPMFDNDGSIIVSGIAGVTDEVQTFGDGLEVVGTNLFVNGKFTRDHQLKGDALVYRFKDTGASGVEWGIRSDGGNFEIVRNTGTESTPIWTLVTACPATGILNYKAKVTSDDTTGDYLYNKLTASSGMAITTHDDGGNETLVLSTLGKCLVNSSDPAQQYLEDALVEGSNIVLTTETVDTQKKIKITGYVENSPISVHCCDLVTTSTEWADMTPVDDWLADSEQSILVYIPAGYTKLTVKLAIGRHYGFKGTISLRLRCGEFHSNEYAYTDTAHDYAYFGMTDALTIEGLTADSVNEIFIQGKAVNTALTGGGGINAVYATKTPYTSFIYGVVEGENNGYTPYEHLPAVQKLMEPAYLT